MKYLLVLFLPIVFMMGCKKPEEVNPENTETTVNDSYLQSIIIERILYGRFDYGAYYTSNDTIYQYISNMKSGYNNNTDYFNHEYDINVGREDSISVNNSKYSFYSIRQKLNSEIIHTLSVKTKDNRTYQYKLVLKRALVSFNYNSFQDSLCTDSINIQRNINYANSNISLNTLFGWKSYEKVYTDQVLEKNGKINYYIYVLAEKSQHSFKLLNLNRDYSDLVKTYEFGKNVIALGEKDFTGSLSITSYNPKSKTISGNFSYTSTSEHKGYKSSPAKITVTDGKFENIPLWDDN